MAVSVNTKSQELLVGWLCQSVPRAKNCLDPWGRGAGFLAVLLVHPKLAQALQDLSTDVLMLGSYASASATEIMNSRAVLRGMDILSAL